MRGSIRIWDDRKPVRILVTESLFTRTPVMKTDSTGNPPDDPVIASPQALLVFPESP